MAQAEGIADYTSDTFGLLQGLAKEVSSLYNVGHLVLQVMLALALSPITVSDFSSFL